MANKRLSPALADVIGACYEEGLKTMEIRDFLNGERQFGLNLTYHEIRNHNPAVVAQRKEYYGMPDVKDHMKDIHRGNYLRRQAKKIRAMADRVEKGDVIKGHIYRFSRGGGEKTRKKILDYMEERPGLNFSGITKGLGLKNGACQYQLNRLFREGRIYKEPMGYKRKGNFYPLHKTVHRVYHAICETPCLTQTELAKELNIVQSDARYHAEKLVRDGKVLREKMGKEVRYRKARNESPEPKPAVPFPKEIVIEWDETRR